MILPRKPRSSYSTAAWVVAFWVLIMPLAIVALTILFILWKAGV